MSAFHFTSPRNDTSPQEEADWDIECLAGEAEGRKVVKGLINRDDRREAIFEDDEDRQRLLQTLTEACEKTGWQAC